MGVYGAAIATAVSYFICFVIRAADTRKYIYFKINTVRVTVNSVLLVIMAAVSVNQPGHFILILTGIFIVIVSVNIQNFMNFILQLPVIQKIKA